MKGLRNAAIAHKKPDAQLLKTRKADALPKKEKASKKNPGVPKRPASAYFVFMEDFRKTHKENFPDNKSVAAVAKAGGEKWKSMSDADKAPYAAIARKRKAEYEKAMDAYKKNQVAAAAKDDTGPAASEKSSSEVHDDGDQEASS